MLRADGVWLATGHALDASRVTPLETLRTLRPQPFHDGLPELTPSLREEVKAFEARDLLHKVPLLMASPKEV